MKNVKKCITLIFISLLLTGCQKEKFNINEEVILRGKVTTREIIENNESYKVNILNLDEPIIINGTKVKKIELDYDKDLKNDKELEIKGIINPIDEVNSVGEKKREYRILFRWNDGEENSMDNKADTQFRGEQQEDNLHTTLKYKAMMTFTQYILPEEETTT